MEPYKGEYLGMALQSFLKATQRYGTVAGMILQQHGLSDIDPEAWYDLNTARSIYYTVGEQVGPNTLETVGMSIIETARFPDNIQSVRQALESLDIAYKMNVRGEDIGYISCDFKASNRATVTFSVPFPCHLNRGIIRGCARSFGQLATVSHGQGCRDQGANECTYFVQLRSA